jgi:hypothetical protein
MNVLTSRLLQAIGVTIRIATLATSNHIVSHRDVMRSVVALLAMSETHADMMRRVFGPFCHIEHMSRSDEEGFRPPGYIKNMS